MIEDIINDKISSDPHISNDNCFREKVIREKDWIDINRRQHKRADSGSISLGRCFRGEDN